MNLLEVADLYLQIPLGGVQRLMSQQSRDVGDIDATAQQVRCNAMAEEIERDREYQEELNKGEEIDG